VDHVYIDFMGDSIALPVGESLLGRESGCTFRINDPSVSRRHARLIHRAGEVFVEDLGSANGTLLNGRTVAAPIRLCHGDVITVGNRELKVTFANEHDDQSTVQILVAAAAAPRRGPRMGARTAELPVMKPALPTANARCPRCSAVIAAADRACGNCSYRWGNEPLAAATSLNRRRDERYSAELRVRYVAAGRELEATTLDISASGVFVCMQDIDMVGTPCVLEIAGGDSAMRLSGVVRRVALPGTVHAALVGVGIELVDVGDTERDWLESLVQHLVEV